MVTPADIRYHLAALRDQNLVTPFRVRTSEKRGRPQTCWSLALPARDHNLVALASALLDEIKIPRDERAYHSHLDELARHMAPVPNGVNHSLAQRLTLAIRHLNASFYQARWEAHTAGPRIYLHHCPYAALVPQHAELCELDARILSQLVEAGVTQIAQVEINHAPDCVFIVNIASR